MSHAQCLKVSGHSVCPPACSQDHFVILYSPARVEKTVDLHSLGLYEVEDVALGRGADVEPNTGHQMAERATSREVRAPADVEPLPQHLQCTIVSFQLFFFRQDWVVTFFFPLQRYF